MANQASTLQPLPHSNFHNPNVRDWQLHEFTDNDDPSEGAIHGGIPQDEQELAAALALPEPPTLEEIEAIQQTAWQEGFEQGKQDGFAEGLSEGRLTGAEQGLQQGLEQGRREGIAAGEQEIIQRCAQLDKLLDQLLRPLAAVDDQVEQELLQLTMKLAQALIQVELKTNPQALLHTLQTALAALPSQQQAVTIHANGDDLALIEQSYGVQELGKRQWQLELDPALSPGSLQISTERSQVVVSSEQRIAQLLNQFIASPRDPVIEPDYPTAATLTDSTDAEVIDLASAAEQQGQDQPPLADDLAPEPVTVAEPDEQPAA
ncbi:flagellar assembly protein FliH [Ferrimonas senticii]|uniref:flagellar assembly protein FliH n=1 Tax=Ferrimonas senticii TaxID=394566 RepID=UPI0004234C05|nr:flagellar assembly protein FliH [Ferrimonas senticii]